MAISDLIDVNIQVYLIKIKANQDEAFDKFLLELTGQWWIHCK